MATLSDDTTVAKPPSLREHLSVTPRREVDPEKLVAYHEGGHAAMALRLGVMLRGVPSSFAISQARPGHRRLRAVLLSGNRRPSSCRLPTAAKLGCSHRQDARA